MVIEECKSSMIWSVIFNVLLVVIIAVAKEKKTDFDIQRIDIRLKEYLLNCIKCATFVLCKDIT